MGDRKDNIQLLYKTMDAMQKIVEAQLDILTYKGNTPDFEDNLLNLAELSIKLLRKTTDSNI